MSKWFFLLLLTPVLFTSCSPLRSSPSDGQHLLELTLHEIQTNLDDLRHSVNCFQTELQILEGRLQTHEQTLTELGVEKQQGKIEQLSKQIQALEKNWDVYQKGQTGTLQEFKQFQSYAGETSNALAQFKKRILEIEQELLEQNRRFEELAKIKGNLESLAKTWKQGGDSLRLYRVKQGDTLEKIARLHQSSVEKIKKYNDLQQDVIVIGQQLKIPPE